MGASNQAFIIAAYAVTWIVIFGYLWRLHRKGEHANELYELMSHPHAGENRK